MSYLHMHDAAVSKAKLCMHDRKFFSIQEKLGYVAVAEVLKRGCTGDRFQGNVLDLGL